MSQQQTQPRPLYLRLRRKRIKCENERPKYVRLATTAFFTATGGCLATPGRTGGAVRDRGNSLGGCPDLAVATPSVFELGKAGRRPPVGNREASGAADCKNYEQRNERCVSAVAIIASLLSNLAVIISQMCETSLIANRSPSVYLGT
jgi:hypothetical protein